MATLKLRAIGNSVGLVLPKELLARLNLAEGDSLHVVEASDGLRLVRHDPEFERQMETAREVMHRRRAVLRELAK
jgi:putative addiction module antidote